MPQHHEQVSDASSPHHEIVTLLTNVEQLENMLEETRSMLEVKDKFKKPIQFYMESFRRISKC